MASTHLIRRAALAVSLSLACAGAFAADNAPILRDTVNVTPATEEVGRFIVTYREGAAERNQPALAVQSVTAALSRGGIALAATRSQAAPVTYLRKLSVGSDVIRTNRKLSVAEANALMQQLAADPAVESVQPDRLRRPTLMPQDAATAVTPDDPLYASYQWHLRAGDGAMEKIGNDSTAYANRGGANVANAWALADGAGVVVAVLDTGITHHSDLDLSLADAGYDFISDGYVSGRDNDDRVPGGWDTGDWTTDAKYTDPVSGCVPSSQASDSSWHGTHVAGTIAELTGNTKGMAGAAHGARVLPVRVLGHCGGYDSDIADAITWASGGHVNGVPDNQHPAQVINMSLGGSGSCSASDVSGKAIAGAIARGTAVVVSAGNAAKDAANYSPASCPGVISVAANGITGKRSFFSNYGNSVTLAAPGGGVYANDASSGSIVKAGFVWSAINMGAHEPGDENYGGMAGTSQAAPHVAGTLAMVIGARKAVELPALTPAQLTKLLTDTARAFPAKPDQTIGAGIVDAEAAVLKAIDTTPPPAEPVVDLKNGMQVTLTAKQGDSTLYRIKVPAGARSLSMRTLGGSGDVQLFVKTGQAPAADGSDAAYKSVKPGSAQAVMTNVPAAGDWYIRVRGATAINGVTVLASFTTP